VGPGLRRDDDLSDLMKTAYSEPAFFSYRPTSTISEIVPSGARYLIARSRRTLSPLRDP
jgi:hypothetical protein